MWDFLFSSLKKKTSLGRKPFKLVFVFYAPEGAALSMPVTILSAYAKKYVPGLEVCLAEINMLIGGAEHSPTGFAERVRAAHPDLVAISCMSPHWQPLDPYLRALKQAVPEAAVLVGGYQAILSPEETIAHPAVDYICVGDGEEPLVGIINKLLGRQTGDVPGLWEKRPNMDIVRREPVLTANLTGMPFSDYSIFEREGSLRGLGFSIFGPKNLFILPVMTGRGCPYRCSYCCNTPMLERHKGAYIRKYDPEAFIEELCRLRDRYAVDYFEFWDELFLSNMKFAYQFLELYRKQIGLPFSVNSRVEKMDEQFCRTAREAGCHTIWFGIESGSEVYRQTYLGRRMTNAQIITASDNARKYGIRRLTFNIAGMPFETKAHLLETLELNRSISPDFFFFFPYIPLRGTPLYDIAKQHDLLLAKTAQDYLEGSRSGAFHLNIKEHAGGMTNEEFQEVCMQMADFQMVNNRLDMDEDASDRLPREDGVSDRDQGQREASELAP